MGNFRELDVWKEAGHLAVEVYRISARLPISERFGLQSQLRRAAVSVSTNIAEGTGRGGDREFARFLRIARGSSREVESLLEVGAKLGLLSASDLPGVLKLADSISRRLTNLIRSLGG